ncbi:MAG TPA: RNA polymerase sigma-70 factor [Chitinophaga sp.]|uniref:RNA polymerase sigma-70 factor n=1 Tax=Chitinophaga sp. TaxID=1869181 RepID=UPI002D0D1F44|nr:RNA polymerase sigma-70 factor [Chitinophaga sp.]HVI47502.1 RNA polymerase sigma-70 factor [Chitinophaga sp.]
MRTALCFRATLTLPAIGKAFFIKVRFYIFTLSTKVSSGSIHLIYNTVQSEREKELLLNVSQGDEVAFATLFYTYHNRLGAFVLQLTGSLPLAEEIVQEVFIRIWEKRDKLSQVTYFHPYLYAVAKNYTLSFLKKMGREMARRQEWEMSVAASQEDDHTVFYHAIIDQAVAELPAQRQKVYLMSRDEGLRQAEIAERLAISLETVKKHMVLALRSIRSYALAHPEINLLLLLITSLFSH